MNLKCCIVIFALSMVSAAMAQDMPWRYDFEAMGESYQVDAGSEVSLSTRRYKGGQQSLKFAWQNNGRLVFTDPAPGRNKDTDRISGVGCTTRRRSMRC